MGKHATQIKVTRREGEDFEHMFKRFKKAYQESGILAEARKKEFYVGKSEKRRLKHEEALKVKRKEERQNAFYTDRNQQ